MIDNILAYMSIYDLDNIDEYKQLFDEIDFFKDHPEFLKHFKRIKIGDFR